MGIDDLSLFREALPDVTLLPPPNQARHYTRKPSALPLKTLEDERQVIQDMLSDAYDPTELQPGDILSYCRPGLQHKIFRKLRSGQYRVFAELDLHGLNARQAKQMLLTFLHQVHPGMGDCVRVIHGKGNRSDHRGPVLKTKINHWLRQHDRVLAFHSARPPDGGTGAVYVLLRR